MEMPINTLMVEGTAEDQILEMAQYIDGRRATQGLSAEVIKLVEADQKEEALKKIVDGSSVLSAAPEKEFTPAYNLLIHLVRQSPNFANYLPILLKNLSTPPTSSPNNGPYLIISVLSTLFNVLPATSPHRYSIFKTILNIVATHNLYEVLDSQLKSVEKWVQEWGSTPEEVRDLYIPIANIAEESGDNDVFYTFLLKALQTYPSGSASQARDIATRIVKAAINIPTRLEFDDLIALDSVQALSNSDPELFQLFEVFAGGQLEDYIEFNDEHDDWVEENGINHAVAHHKIRLLTLTSLAASCSNRELPYNIISRYLQVPAEEVEHWVIDVIRAGLVEGKLSQLNQTFLIHRASYRQFGKAEWEEVASRLDVWKTSLRGILEVVKNAREQATIQAEKEKKQVQNTMNSLNKGNKPPLEVEG